MIWSLHTKADMLIGIYLRVLVLWIEVKDITKLCCTEEHKANILGLKRWFLRLTCAIKAKLTPTAFYHCCIELDYLLCDNKLTIGSSKIVNITTHENGVFQKLKEISSYSSFPITFGLTSSQSSSSNNLLKENYLIPRCLVQ